MNVQADGYDQSINVVSMLIDGLIGRVAAIEFDKSLKPFIKQHAVHDTLGILKCHANMQKMFKMDMTADFYNYQEESEEPKPSKFGNRYLKVNFRP